MTVKELRDILSNEFIDDDLIPLDYEENMVESIDLVVDKDGTVSEIRFGMSKA